MDTRIVLEGLSPNTNYSLSLCAFTDAGCGRPSTSINQTDEDGEGIVQYCTPIAVGELRDYIPSLPSHMQLHCLSQTWSYNLHQSLDLTRQ